MSTFLTERKKVERNKRYLFLGSSAAGIFFAITGSTFLAAVGIGAGAFFGYKWFDYRAKNGMRF